MGIEVVRCPGHAGCVDIIDSRGPESDPLHLTAAEWQDWVDTIKAGKLDHVAQAVGSQSTSGSAASRGAGTASWGL